MSRRLSDKVCIVTGTGGSVGRAAAEATAEMVRAQGGTMISLQPCHLTEPADCRALVDFAVDTCRQFRCNRTIGQRRGSAEFGPAFCK
jgi:NAD(P)-dependent dehydrogenase (short-subunit alcohol dehydrogenase family)